MVTINVCVHLIGWPQLRWVVRFVHYSGVTQTVIPTKTLIGGHEAVIVFPTLTMAHCYLAAKWGTYDFPVGR